MKMIFHHGFTLLFTGLAGISFSQTNTYILNGTATQDNCNCYTLTQPANFQGGSVWNANKIDLNQPFDFWFNVFLGSLDDNGADGIVFILQPNSTSLGASGGGMGFQGMTPSIGITLDTWQNAEFNDPPEDHISIQVNGNITHGTDLAGPVAISAANNNVEDGIWHVLGISWEPVTKKITTWFDGQHRLTATIDLVANVFNNDPMVFWGFAGATGGAVNLQGFCTALNPAFTTDIPATGSCVGNAISFQNESQAFGPIQSYLWNFGDGTTSTDANPPPHIYTAAGSYEVQLVVTGFDGCITDTKRMVHVGAWPEASFTAFDTCLHEPPQLLDQSSSSFGDITEWWWYADGVQVGNVQSPQIDQLDVGPHTLQLVVKNQYGCASDTASQNFNVRPLPVITAEFSNGCIDEPVSFNGGQIDNATQISQWIWQFGDGSTSQQQHTSKSFTSTGNHPFSLQAVATNGCSSSPFTATVFINEAKASAGNDTIAIKDQPMQLHASGGSSYNWSPSTGLNSATIANPVAVLQDDIIYTVTVTTDEGCMDTDEVKITVFKGSAIYVPTAFTPNHDGKNDVLRPALIGIKKLYHFSVYNRWGQLVFSTREPGQGWDGRLKGGSQASGSFVWVVRAEDYVGKMYELKGTTIIIR